MDNKSFTKTYYETKIFNELKDIFFVGVNDMKKRYPDLDVDYYDIYRRILNYRIEKYGSSFMVDPNSEDHRSRKDCIKKSDTARRRKRYRLWGK